MAELTPMMKQYLNIKKSYPDAILFFRLGDFYEMFYEDAKLASDVLDLVLTGKDCGQDERAPMCGVPFHSADSYIAKLVSKGYNVAICEQIEDPKTSKGLVKRDIVRIVTKGTVIESSMLEEGKNNFLSSVFANSNGYGISFVDISTGKAMATFVDDKKSSGKILDEFFAFSPSEILCNKSIRAIEKYSAAFENVKTALVEGTNPAEAEETVKKYLNGKIPEGPGKEEIILSFALALNYLNEVQKNTLSNINELEIYSDLKYMRLDAAARSGLELTETSRGKEKRGSLLWVIDKTKTAMGKRMMRSFIEKPLQSCTDIIGRQKAIEALLEDKIVKDDIREYLLGINDMERLITRISYGNSNGREVKSLSDAIENIPSIKDKLKNFDTKLLNKIRADIDCLGDVRNLIENTMSEDPPFSVREGGLIGNNVNEELDALRELLNDGKGYLAKIEREEQEKSGIKKLKVGYNRVFGYYIEVPKAFSEDVPENYIRKQTLSNCERYITEELKNLEAKVLGAKERIATLEYELFSRLRQQIAEQIKRIQKTSEAIALLDALISLAETALENNYICPEISDGFDIIIRDGRHPVIEKTLRNSLFVPNDIHLDSDNNLISVITGPNMAGKSTYMRQVALIVIMAHMGSFVPASYAKISVTDSIFTRVGASDDLNMGLSTFMTEMKEVADILKGATARSLIIFDEIGRGTSTFDGMSIAAAVLEYVADKKRCGAKTLFATHYHELTELEHSFPNVKNFSIACKKRGDDIIFLRRIIRGPADGSYGIEVAVLAGVPDAVVKRAKVILKKLEENEQQKEVMTSFEKKSNNDVQLSFDERKNADIIRKIKDTDINTLTPIEAMKMLFDLNREANS